MFCGDWHNFVEYSILLYCMLGVLCIIFCILYSLNLSYYFTLYENFSVLALRRDSAKKMHKWIILVCNWRHYIIHIHNSVLWDWHNLVEYSILLYYMLGVFCRISSVPRNIVMDLNDGMGFWLPIAQKLMVVDNRTYSFMHFLAMSRIDQVATDGCNEPSLLMVLRSSHPLPTT